MVSVICPDGDPATEDPRGAIRQQLEGLFVQVSCFRVRFRVIAEPGVLFYLNALVGDGQRFCTGVFTNFALYSIIVG